MTEEKTFAINLKRVELSWLHRQIALGRDKAEENLKHLHGPLSDDKVKERTKTRIFFDDLSKQTQTMKDALDAGTLNRIKAQEIREELEEAIELIGEDGEALTAINIQLEKLPKEEDYRISFTRDSAKFTIEIIEKDLQRFRSHVIPSYEKRNAIEYTDPIRTKTYWINKARKAKTILEVFKTKLEKEL